MHGQGQTYLSLKTGRVFSTFGRCRKVHGGKDYVRYPGKGGSDHRHICIYVCIIYTVYTACVCIYICIYYMLFAFVVVTGIGMFGSVFVVAFLDVLTSACCAF